MIQNVEYQLRLSYHLQYLSDALMNKMKDDALMYDILALSKETLICYFLEPNETSGGVGLFTEANVPDSVFSSGTLVGFTEITHQNTEAVYPRIIVTIPFAEKEDKNQFQTPPRKTKYPAISKAVLQKGIQDLNKIGVNKFVDVSKIGHELFDKYNNVNLVDDVIAVDEKRQQKITENIKNRHDNHQHIQLHYNNVATSNNPAPLVYADKTAIFAMHWLEHGGAEKFAVISMEKAKQLGFDVYCIIDKRGNKHYLESTRKICKNIFNIAEGLPTEYWSRFYINICKYFDVRIFHIHHAISAYQALPKIRALTKVKTVLDTTHIIEHNDGGYVRISGVYSQYLNYHHTISQELNDYLTGEIHVPHHKIQLGYLFNQAEELTLDASKLANINQEMVISFIGRLVNQKRPYLYVELINRILKNPALKDKNIKFNMMGEGPLWKVRDDLIKQYQLENKITILPADSDVNHLLEKSHFLIISSENEGLTLVAYEAMLNNCIVISADVGSQKEIVGANALVSRMPREFISQTEEIIKQAVVEPNFAKQLLTEQNEKINTIIAKDNWEKVLERIYTEAKND